MAVIIDGTKTSQDVRDEIRDQALWLKSGGAGMCCCSTIRSIRLTD
ncbi:MAG: hypothetical protein JRE40_05480 [Deltaproteobacteria bacterium]|nr:hypothetical protein [Deltaproteobacteria bacterium]